MTDQTKTRVLFEITVPEGKYCWNFHDRICEYFNNEGGGVTCDFGQGWRPIKTIDGYKKPQKCLYLPKAKEIK